MVIDVLSRTRVFIAIGLVAVSVTALFSLRGGMVREPVFPITRVVQYGFEVQNRGNKVAKHVEFWTYAPVKQTSTQRFEKLSVSQPYELIEDELGNQVVHVMFDMIPPFATKIITIQVEIAVSDTPNPATVRNKGQFLKAEHFIEINHPEIQKAASIFAGNGENTAKLIHDWTADHIHGVAYIREDRGALYALQKQSGDCTEYAYLFSALSRVRGIPARPIGGYVLSENGKLAAEAYHNWAEFYLNGSWHVADPQMKVFDEQPSRFIAMNIVSDAITNPMRTAQRFRFTGKNIFVRML